MSRWFTGACAHFALVAAIAAIAIAPAHGAARTHAAPAETLHAFVTRYVAQAPQNFAAVRGRLKDRDVYYAAFGVTPALAKTCAKCKITDEFSWAAHPENWYLEDRWYADKWSSAKLDSYILRELAVLHGYVMTKTGSKDYPKFTWRNPLRTWISVDTFNGGFTVRVGHDLTTPVHVLASPTMADGAALSAAVRSFVTTGTSNAANNFEAVRKDGKKDFMGDMEYGVTPSFGAMLRNCEVSDSSVNTLKLDDYSPKWSMRCDTVPMVGTVASVEELVTTAMHDALPSDYTATTDRNLLFTDDYRWDSGDRTVMADVESMMSAITLPSGLVQLNLGIVHFLPKD